MKQSTIEDVRVAAGHWHALEDDGVVGRGHTTYRPDGRLFVSIDAWHGTTFDLVARAMLASLPRPLHTLVDEADRELTAQWHRVGFVPARREWEYVVPTDPAHTGLGPGRPPRATTIVARGRAEPDRLKALLHAMDEPTLLRDPSRYAAVAWRDEYLGLLRLAPVPRRPVVGLVAVRPDVRRRGIARALLAHVLGDLHDAGTRDVSATVDEANLPAVALVEAVGGRRGTSQLELVLA
jgi:GNAT superfamily N-acetyltransferase